MITVQMTLEPDLVKTVDRLAKRRGLSRSAFTREALAKAVEAESIRAQEEQHRQGYLKKPVRNGEFSVPAGQQIWPD
jgi:metal-responsive CopG/Arc/MetJ family transcriptional regulator